jgi:hypothetical protein
MFLLLRAFKCRFGFKKSKSTLLLRGVKQRERKVFNSLFKSLKMKKIVLVFIAIVALALPKTFAIESGEYIISLDNGKALDADLRSGMVQVWDNVPNSANQRWIVSGSDTRGYTIRCAANNHYLNAGGTDIEQAYLSSDFDEKSALWLILGIEGSSTVNGQGYYIFYAPDGQHHLLNVNTNARNSNGTPVNTLISLKPYASAVRWYFRPVGKTRVKVTLKGISLTNIHNNDCKKVWGTLRAELWEMNGDGTNARQIPNPFAGNAMMMNWTGKTPRNIANYATLTNYMTIDNVNSSVVFSVDPSFLSDRGGMTPDNQLRQRTIVLKIFTSIYAAHKSCDLCTDYTESAGATVRVNSELTQTLYINGAWQSKLRRSFPAKDGPMVAGPFKSVTIADHFYRLHFDIEKLD